MTKPKAKGRCAWCLRKLDRIGICHECFALFKANISRSEEDRRRGIVEPEPAVNGVPLADKISSERTGIGRKRVRLKNRNNYEKTEIDQSQTAQVAVPIELHSNPAAPGTRYPGSGVRAN